MKTLLEFCTPRTTQSNEYPFIEDLELARRLKEKHYRGSLIDVVLMAYNHPTSLVKRYCKNNEIKAITLIDDITTQEELKSKLANLVETSENRYAYLTLTPLPTSFKHWCAEHEIHYQKA